MNFLMYTFTVLLGAFLAFASVTEQAPVLRYGGALLFSALGGMIPGGLFGYCLKLATCNPPPSLVYSLWSVVSSSRSLRAMASASCRPACCPRSRLS